MNILVCIKQVPNTDKIKIDKETNTLIRNNVESIINPFDTYALEFALRIKDQYKETKITAITMGPLQAKKALESAYALGIDNAILISDKKFGGSDTLATSYILAKSIEYLQKENNLFDLILCGKQAIDGDTAQVGPELAEHLNIAQVTYVKEIKIENNSFIVTKETDEGEQTLKVGKNSLLTITKPKFEPRFSSLSMKIKAKKKEIIQYDLSVLENIDKSKIGLKGSPTKVIKTYVNSTEKKSITFEGNSLNKAKEIYKILEKNI